MQITATQAKRILKKSFSVVSVTTLFNPSEYVDSDTINDDGERKITLDGVFTAAELQAISMWMNDPVSVINSK